MLASTRDTVSTRKDERMHSRFRLAVIALLALACLSAGRGRDASSRLVGTWELDAEATREAIESSPRWEAMGGPEKAMLGKLLETLVSSVSMTFTRDAVTTTAMGKIDEASYKVVSSNGDTLVISTQSGDSTSRVTIVFQKDGSMQISSDATDDMDYYVWQRAE